MSPAELLCLWIIYDLQLSYFICEVDNIRTLPLFYWIYKVVGVIRVALTVP